MTPDYIPAGYQLQITTWENDADAYKTQIFSGLERQEVAFLLAIATQFRSASNGGAVRGNLGNREQPAEKLVQVWNQAFKTHGMVLNRQEFIDEWTLQGDDDEEKEDDVVEKIYELLGTPVEYDGLFCRVFSSFEVYKFEAPAQKSLEFEAEFGKFKR